MVSAVADEATRLENRLSEILQAYRAGERRLYNRQAAGMLARAMIADQWHDCEIVSTSPSGGLCRGLPVLESGTALILEMPEFGAIEAEGERRWRQRTLRARRDAVKLLHRLERAIEPPKRKRPARKKAPGKKTAKKQSPPARAASRPDAALPSVRPAHDLERAPSASSSLPPPPPH